MFNSNGLSLNKAVGVASAAPEVQTSQVLNLAKMIDQVSGDCLTEIANSYYTNGNLNDERADRALQSIKGKMAALKMLVGSMQ